MTEFHDNTRPIMAATLFQIGDSVKIAALICGEGVDLHVGRAAVPRCITVQLTVDEARAAAQALLAAADESASDA